MKNALKTALLAALVLIFAGGILIGVAYLAGARLSQLWEGDGIFGNYSGVSYYGDDMRSLDNEYSPDDEYSVSTTDINSLNVNWVAGSVEVNLYDGGEIVFKESAQSDISEENALRYGVDSGTLYIQYCSRGVKEELPLKHLKIMLPRELAARLGIFDFSSASASLTVGGLVCESFEFSSASGELAATDIKTGELDASSSSGDISFAGECGSIETGTSSGKVCFELSGETEYISISSSSGDISVSAAYGLMSVSTASGKVELTSLGSATGTTVSTSSGAITLQGSGEFGELSVDTASGDVSSAARLGVSSVDVESSSGAVELAFLRCPEALVISTGTGRVSLALPSDSSCTVRYETGSGDMKCDFPVALNDDEYIIGGGTAQFSIETSSGDLLIKTAG